MKNHSQEKPSPSLGQWERLKRLTFIIDGQRKLEGPSLSEPDPNGVRFLQSAETTPEVSELHHLVYEMGLVSPEHLVKHREIVSKKAVKNLGLKETCENLTTIFRVDRFEEGLIADEINTGVIQDLCRHAYLLSLTTNGWPNALELNDDGKLPLGLVFKSLTGTIEGRTTGGRRECPANGCPGWLASVLWESGQQLHICSEGWHFDPDYKELRVIGGGEITARFINPTEPHPREQWIARSELMASAAWSE